MSGFKNLKDKEVEDAKITKELLNEHPSKPITPVEKAKQHRGDEWFAEYIALLSEFFVEQELSDVAGIRNDFDPCEGILPAQVMRKGGAL